MKRTPILSYQFCMIEFCKLTRRSINCLKQNNIFTIDDLLKTDTKNLENQRNFGSKTQTEIDKFKTELLLTIHGETWHSEK